MYLSTYFYSFYIFDKSFATGSIGFYFLLLFLLLLCFWACEINSDDYYDCDIDDLFIYYGCYRIIGRCFRPFGSIFGIAALFMFVFMFVFVFVLPLCIYYLRCGVSLLFVFVFVFVFMFVFMFVFICLLSAICMLP